MIEDKYFKPVENTLIERQDREWETLGTGRSEELPSEMEERHEEDWDNLEKRRVTCSLDQWRALYPNIMAQVGRTRARDQEVER
jgi:hypothetical protein